MKYHILVTIVSIIKAYTGYKDTHHVNSFMWAECYTMIIAQTGVDIMGDLISRQAAIDALNVGAVLILVEQ